MSTSANNLKSKQGLVILLGIILLVSFFLPWVNWDGSSVNGAAMATGGFFKTSETRFGLGNPFPKLSFSFLAFWLIPLLTIVMCASVFLKKKSTPIAFLVGALSLALVTVYTLFTGVLVDLGVGNSIAGMLKPGIYLHTLAAIGLIILAFPVKNQLPKIGWLLLGPLLAYGSFKFGEKYIREQTFKGTESVKADYTLEAEALITEFLSNNMAANKKYLDKVIVVNGKASAVELLADSTSTIKFADSTGSYAIFSLDKDQFEQVQKIQPGAAISMKGVCSGSIFSEILGTTSISFKRATFNNQ